MPKIRQTENALRNSTIYWPKAAPRGGIVCLHGSEGGSTGWNHVTCTLLAAQGFAAMAHSYTFSDALLTRPNIDDVPLEPTVDALAEMRRLMAEHGCGRGLYGVSRGAELALLVTELLTESESPALPDAVAVHAPPDRIYPAFILADFQTGKPIAGDLTRPAWRWRGEHARVRPGSLLHPEIYRGPLLITQGTQDQVWSSQMAVDLVARLRAAGRSPEFHRFEDEGHGFRAEARNRQLDLLSEFFVRNLGAPSS